MNSHSSRAVRQSTVSRELNKIFITHLDGPYVIRDIVLEILDARKSGFEEIELNLSKLVETSYFPNVLTPIAAFLDNLRSDNKLVITLAAAPRQIEHTNFLAPQHSGLTSQYPNILDKVWKFDSPEDVFKLVTEYMDAIYKADVFEGEHVLSWIEWCLNEVMDNVIQHAEADAGYVMGQIHPNSKHIAFCIADAGRGIYESLRTSTEYFPSSAADALTLALKEGVTRDNKIGQGNGLWGLQQVVHKSTGKLTLASSGASLDASVTGAAETRRATYLNSRQGGTVVDFQLDYSKAVSLTDILGGHNPESLKIYRDTDDDGNKILYRLSEQKSGFGTRKSGERIRNEIVNMIGESGKNVQINFSGVGIVSSSFADELVGKLFVGMGPLRFSQQVRLVNMNDTVGAIVNKAMEQRMMQELTKR